MIKGLIKAIGRHVQDTYHLHSLVPLLVTKRKLSVYPRHQLRHEPISAIYRLSHILFAWDNVACARLLIYQGVLILMARNIHSHV